MTTPTPPQDPAAGPELAPESLPTPPRATSIKQQLSGATRPETTTQSSLGVPSAGGTGRSWINGNARRERPVSRYVAPVEAPEPEAPKSPWRRVLILVAAAIVVGMVAGGLWVTLRPAVDDPDTTVAPSGDPTAELPKIEQPDQVVRQYLDALARGDAQAAVALGGKTAGDPAAISNEAYAVSATTHPISNVNIPKMEAASASVPAKYRVGNSDVAANYSLVRENNGGWSLSRSTLQMDFSVPNGDELPITLNGAPISGRSAALLPGHYKVSTGLPYIEYGRDSEITITSLEYQGIAHRTLTPELTQTGADAFMAAGRSSLYECLAAKTLNPEGCPNQLSANGAYDPGSVQWRLVDDPFANTTPSVDSSDLSRGQATVLLRFAVTFNYTDGSSNGDQALSPQTASFSSSLKANDPSQINIIWTR